MADATKKAPKTAAPQAPKADKPAKAPRPGLRKATAAAPEGERCSVDKCKQPIRARGLCRKHYMAWRRGEYGKKQRYKICSKEGCRKPATLHGRCDEHRKGQEAKAA